MTQTAPPAIVDRAAARPVKVRRWSLSTRLVLVLIALVIIALGATDAITYTSLRSYLFQQVDTTLTSISTVSNGPGAGRPGRAGALQHLRPG